jgi:hypothetical protein
MFWPIESRSWQRGTDDPIGKSGALRILGRRQRATLGWGHLLELLKMNPEWEGAKHGPTSNIIRRANKN